MTGVALVDQSNLDTSNLPKAKITLKLILLTILAVVGGFLFGYDTGVISGATLYLKIQFSLDTIEQELVVSVTIAAAAVAALVGGLLNQFIGRKWTIIISSVLFIVGSVVLAATPPGVFAQLLVGRIIVGFAIGISSTTIPLYIAECSPPRVRGIMITMFQLMITFGLLMASVIDAAFSYIKDDNINWRLMLVFPVIPGLIQLLGFLFMPESPRWLVERGRDDQALKVLTSINGGDDDAAKIAVFELEDIKATHDETVRVRREAGGKNIILAMLETPTIRKALIIGFILQMFQQLCGINTVMYYGATIIQMGGISNATQAIWMASITSAVNFVCTFLGVYLVDKIGRRLLLLGSMIGVTLMLILLGIGFLVIKINSPEAYYIENNAAAFNDSCSLIKSCDDCSYKPQCGFCFDDIHNASLTGSCVAVYDDKNNSLHVANTQWADYGRCKGVDVPNSPNFVDPNAEFNYGFCPTSYSYLPIIGMVLYLCSFSAGFGPIPWIICAEIFPTWARSTGTAITTASNWLFNLLISLTYLTISDNLGRSNAFFLYAAITFVGIVFCFLVIPETRGKKMEEIEVLLQGPFISCGKEPSGVTSPLGNHYKKNKHIEDVVVRNFKKVSPESSHEEIHSNA